MDDKSGSKYQEELPNKSCIVPVLNGEQLSKITEGSLADFGFQLDPLYTWGIVVDNDGRPVLVRSRNIYTLLLNFYHVPRVPGLTELENFAVLKWTEEL